MKKSGLSPGGRIAGKSN